MSGASTIYRSSGLPHQHQRYVINGTSFKDSRFALGSQPSHSSSSLHHLTTSSIHRQGTGPNDGSFSGTTENMLSTRPEESATPANATMDVDDNDQYTSTRRASMVARSPTPVEWCQLPTSHPTAQDLHRCI
ncbi:hypothetical protein BDB00DRAFT_320512 [Zychaea mexicana]|uniref:uncharacterized protein n=1 Tax=Zychaea mexicana TaxID=64656 RepID=UPI0022FEAA12|nr:uncharacterized protein BDB00DRAFT_320512 [Zychaea mexicana]KAI9466493.1 hypothetical protein BDB00DRAFT_320512 [Zychaea mexicana]